IGRLLTWTTDFLKSKGAAEARLDAQLLLAHVLGCDKIALYTRFSEEPTEQQRGRLRELVQRRAKGCPVAYLLGEREFFSLTFEVTPDVLIPRGDTGVLVNECLDAIKPLPQPRVLDVGTGSGCVAVAVAKQDKRARVTATDVSPKALAVARRNADRHKVEVRFLEGDLFAAVPPGERFDVIVSNPPYIRRDVLSTLAAEVRDHEPRLALDGGDDGFAVIDRLVAGTGSHLAPNGWLIFEIGHDQEAEALARLGRAGWAARATHDAAGHPRVMRARRA
ncbi:MAG: peptide chain release factor N(5)-glutamine methyltransferase, partial [Gemmataceae bacterium]